MTGRGERDDYAGDEDATGHADGSVDDDTTGRVDGSDDENADGRPDESGGDGTTDRVDESDGEGVNGRVDGGGLTETGGRVGGGASTADRGDLRTAFLIARTELRATLRRLVGDPRQLIGVLLGFGSFGFFPLLLADTLVQFGRRAAAGDPSVGVAGGAVAAVVAGGAFVGVTSALDRSRVGAVGPLLRTSSPPRAVAVGRLFGELFQPAVFFSPIAIVVGCVVGYGAGDPVLPVTLAVGLAVPLAAAVVCARATASAVRYAGLLSGVSVWTKVTVGLVAAVGGIAGGQFLLSSALGDGGLADSVGSVLPAAPAQAYAAVMLGPYGAQPTVFGVVLAGVAVVALSVGLAGAARVETLILLRDEGTGPTRQTATGSGSIPWPFTATLTGRVAWRQLRRSKRDPRSLAHLFTFVVGPAAGSGFLLAQPDLVPAVVGAAVPVIGVLVAGAAYCLNPLGDDRDQLPWLFTSLDSTAPLVRARIVAGCVLAAPLIVGGSAVAVVGLSPLFAVGQVLLAVLLAPAVAGIALGIGAVAPKFERSEYLNVERPHPSQPALLGFFFGGGLLVGVGVLVVYLGAAGVVPAVVAVGVVAVYLLVVGGVGVGGYLYAVRRFDALTLDEV